jgi:hypothetical protein
MALRQRRSLPIEQYAIGVAAEEVALAEVLARAATPDPAPDPPTPPRRRSRKT